jgi:hypothetical protein
MHSQPATQEAPGLCRQLCRDCQPLDCQPPALTCQAERHAAGRAARWCTLVVDAHTAGRAALLVAHLRGWTAAPQQALRPCLATRLPTHQRRVAAAHAANALPRAALTRAHDLPCTAADASVAGLQAGLTGHTAAAATDVGLAAADLLSQAGLPSLAAVGAAHRRRVAAAAAWQHAANQAALASDWVTLAVGGAAALVGC